jgi:hypothetical protein
MEGHATEDIGILFVYIFGIFCGNLAYLMVIVIWYTYFEVVLYIFPHFGMLYQEKSGNPDQIDLRPSRQSFSDISAF